MKNIYRFAYLAGIALLGATPLLQAMEPVKKTKTVLISPSAPYSMPVIVRQMVLDLPVLNAKDASNRYTIIHHYFQAYGPTLLSISSFIQSGIFRPGRELAEIIRNRKIKDGSHEYLGDYLYEIAKLHHQDRTMAWLEEQRLADKQNHFFQRMFQIALNQIIYAQPSRADLDQNNFKAADAELWLKLGAQVDAQDGIGMTALMRRANTDGETGIAQMKFLLEHGANPNLQNIDGNTALHLSTNVAKTNLLLAHGASTTILNKAGKRP
jgi:hypothetical protein